MASQGNYLYDALVNRFTEKGLDEVFANGLLLAVEPPGQDWPYALQDPTGEVPSIFTNRGRYERIGVQISIYHKDFDLVRPLAKQVDDAITCAPLTLLSGRLMVIKPGPVHFMKEDLAQKAVMEFSAWEARAYERNPS
jgi:hypothetical protein